MRREWTCDPPTVPGLYELAWESDADAGSAEVVELRALAGEPRTLEVVGADHVSGVVETLWQYAGAWWRAPLPREP